MSISEEYVSEIIAKLTSKHNLIDWRCSTEKFEEIAQNYFGVLIPVTINGKLDNNDHIIRVVLKLAPTDERYRVSGALTLMFNREMYVYSVLLARYEEIQKNFDTKLVVPNCYYIREEYCKEVIILQDMRENGFKPFTDKSFLDLEHITVSLKSLAAFHALSFILKCKDSALYDAVKKNCVPLNAKTNKRFMDILEDRLIKLLNKFEDTLYEKLIINLKSNHIKYVESASECVRNVCVCHGDIWKENIMFKYENDCPTAACLIDYQTARTCSPAYDVLYLLTSSTDSSLRRIHFFKLLEVYYQAFSQMLYQAGLDSSCVYSRATLDNDLKTVGPAVLIVANTALWLSNGLQEEGHVRSKQVWTTEEEKAEAVRKYKEIMSDIIDDFNDYGYLPLIE